MKIYNFYDMEMSFLGRKSVLLISYPQLEASCLACL